MVPKMFEPLRFDCIINLVLLIIKSSGKIRFGNSCESSAIHMKYFVFCLNVKKKLKCRLVHLYFALEGLILGHLHDNSLPYFS